MGGERKKWSAGGETAGTEPECNAAGEPQTEARRVCGALQNAARAEGAFCEVEWGVVGREEGPATRGAQQKRALVAAISRFGPKWANVDNRSITISCEVPPNC